MGAFIRDQRLSLIPISKGRLSEERVHTDWGNLGSTGVKGLIRNFDWCLFPPKGWGSKGLPPPTIWWDVLILPHTGQIFGAGGPHI